MVKKGKGGADIVLAPIVASGLLATATKLYQDMVDEQKKKTRRGGNAEVEAFAKDDLDLFTAKSAELTQEGGKKRKSRKPKRGGEGEEVVEEALVMEGGKKRKSRKPKRGGEGVLEEVSEVLEGGKAKKRSYRKKKGGDYASVEEELPTPGSEPALTQSQSPVVDASSQPIGQAGGKGKRGKRSGKKRGGNAELLGLYESQLGGITSKLNDLVRG